MASCWQWKQISQSHMLMAANASLQKLVRRHVTAQKNLLFRFVYSFILCIIVMSCIIMHLLSRMFLSNLKLFRFKSILILARTVS
jgi:hypothetical protein